MVRGWFLACLVLIPLLAFPITSFLGNRKGSHLLAAFTSIPSTLALPFVMWVGNLIATLPLGTWFGS